MVNSRSGSWLHRCLFYYELLNCICIFMHFSAYNYIFYVIKILLYMIIAYNIIHTTEVCKREKMINLNANISSTQVKIKNTLEKSKYHHKMKRRHSIPEQKKPLLKIKIL